MAPAYRRWRWGGGSLIVFRRYPELLLVAVLLLLTAFFSRTFSKGVSVGPLYVTEIVMGLSFAIALTRPGVSRSWQMLNRLPLPALALIWFVGAIATVRGLDAYGFAMVKYDIGLVDYTLLLPLLTVIAVDRERHEAMFGTLVACGFVGIAGFALTFSADQISHQADSLFALQGLAAGLYISFAVSWIATRVVNGVPTSKWLTALAPVGLLLMALTSQRSIWMVAIVSLAAVVSLGPSGARIRFGVAVAALLAAAFVAAIGIEAGLNSTLGGVQGRTEPTSDTGGPQLTREFTSLGGGNSAEAENVTWRLAYWKELIGRTPSEPFFGVGFGKPASFTWEGRKYDYRDGHPGPPGSGLNVGGPHNSFVSFLYRLGIPAFAAFLFLFFVAGRNVRRAFRQGDLELDDRVALTTLVAMVAGATMTSSFNEALTGPFIALFFWIPLGLLLVWPATRTRTGEAPAKAR